MRKNGHLNPTAGLYFQEIDILLPVLTGIQGGGEGCSQCCGTGNATFFSLRETGMHLGPVPNLDPDPTLMDTKGKKIKNEMTTFWETKL
jgi:hypothetical protein